MTAYARRSYTDIAVATTLSSGVNNSIETIVIAASTGWPTGASGNFYILIESELMDVASRSGTTLTLQSGGRGANSTTAASHLAGVAVTVVYTASDANEANLAMSKTIGAATAQGQILVADAANSLAAVQAKTSGQILVGSGTTLASVAVSGDATLASTGALTVANSAISLAKMANVATDRLLGRDTAGTGVPEALTVGGGIEFTGSTGIQRSALTGDVTASAGSGATVIGASKVLTSMIADANVTAAKLASDSVTTVKILDANVTNAKIADGTIAIAKLLQTDTTTTYTPVWTQGATITKLAGFNARYERVGNLVKVWVFCQATSSGTTGSSMAFTLPVTAVAQTNTVVGDCRFSNGSDTTLPGVAYMLGSSTTQIACDFGSSPSGTVGGVDATIFQIVSGVSISFCIEYPAN